MVSESSLRSFEEFISSFAYKGGGGGGGDASADTRIVASGAAASRPFPVSSNSRDLADGRREATARAESSPGRPRAPRTPPPLTQQEHRRSRHDFRVTIGGKSVVLSKYFPLPPTASNPIPISKEEEEVEKLGRCPLESTTEHATEGAIQKAPPQPRERKKRAASPWAPASRSQPRVPRGNGHDDLIEPQDLPHKGRGKKKKKKSALLSAAEKKNEAYRRVGDDNTWVPPKSCYNLLQERYYSNPWRVLVICMLLNLTTGKQVRRVLPSLFLLCPDAETATEVPEEDLERVIASLGLHRKRARMIKRFSEEYLGDKWTHVTDLHGVGKYAADAYAIFCVGKPEAVTPEDHKLMDYWRFVCGKEDSVAIKENQQLSGTSGGDDSVA